MKAIALAAATIKVADNAVVIAGGMENMSMVPYALPSARWGYRMDMPFGKIADLMVHDGLYEIFNQYHMGTDGGKHLLDHAHDIVIVSISLIALQHGELGVVPGGDALVAEVPANRIDLVEARHGPGDAHGLVAVVVVVAVVLFRLLLSALQFLYQVAKVDFSMTVPSFRKRPMDSLTACM
jgi:hypothetical protein